MSEILKLVADTPLSGTPFIHTVGTLVLSLLIASALAAFMMFIYWRCHDSLTYNRNFNIALIMLAIASSIIMALLQNNPLFSIGAMGALSICRIRTNTRDPRDLGFVFWSIAIGVSSALGAFFVGLICTLLMGAVMTIVDSTSKRKQDVLTVVIRGQKERIADVQRIFGQTPGSTIQSKNLFHDSFEMVYSLKLPRNEEERLMLIFSDMEGIHGINVLAPQTKVA